jgi:hypothetical protein
MVWLYVCSGFESHPETFPGRVSAGGFLGVEHQTFSALSNLPFHRQPSAHAEAQ